MTQSMALVQQRLAQHYVDTLQRANTAIQRGRGNRSHWYNQIEQDWEQIRHWQAWSAEASDLEKERAKLCVDFSMGGLDILRVRQTPADRIQWMKTALAVAQKIGNTAAECTALHELGHTYFYIGATEDATAVAQMLLKLAEPRRDSFNLGRAWYILGQVGVHQGQLDEAEAAFIKGLAYLQEAGAEPEYGRALQAYGRIALYRGDNQTAYERFAGYLTIVERSGREAELAPAYITMNHVLLEMHDYPQAKHYAERALQVCLKTGFQRMLANAWLSLAAAEAELDELDAARTHYLQGITSARAMQANSTVIDLLRYLADVEMRQQHYTDAQQHLQEALELAQQHNISYYLCEISAALAHWHIDQHQAAAARVHLRTAFDYAQQLRADRFLVVVLARALRLFPLEGQTEQAVVWFGVLTRYAHYVEPRVIADLQTHLQQGLSAAQFEQALTRGADIQLADAVTEVLSLIQ
jgi:tetratricopeptide (TPR) repeat protein